MTAVMYSIDQGAVPIPASMVTLEGSTVKIIIPGIGGTYDGTLSGDGNSIKGTWTQGPMPLALNLARATTETAWAIPAPPPSLKPMAPDYDPVFEVASIKPSNPDVRDIGFRIRPREFSTFNTTLMDLIVFAYSLHMKQLSGGPSWMSSSKFDILAKPDGEGQPSEKQWKLMVQKLMADRFKLSFHREKRELSAYAIVVGKSGSKLTRSAGDPNELPSLGFPKLGDLVARNASIGDLAGLMQSFVMDRPVEDQAGVTGRYDFTLKWTPDETQFVTGWLGVRPPAAAVDDPAAPPDLYTAIQEQLGLKLESTKARAEILVIDHVEEPSPN